MSLQTLNIGDVVRTENEYTSTGREAKSRWFIYLGQTNVFNNPRNIFLCTTTTNLKRFEKVDKNSVVYFYKKDNLFESDCVLYLEDIETQFTFESFQAIYNPIYKGNIGFDKLREIIFKIKAVSIARHIKNDIIESFRLANIPTS